MYCLDDIDAKGRKWRDEKLFGSFEQPHQSLKLSAFYCVPRGMQTVKPFYQNHVSWQQALKCNDYRFKRNDSER